MKKGCPPWLHKLVLSASVGMSHCPETSLVATENIFYSWIIWSIFCLSLITIPLFEHDSPRSYLMLSDCLANELYMNLKYKMKQITIILRALKFIICEFEFYVPIKLVFTNEFEKHISQIKYKTSINCSYFHADRSLTIAT